MILNYKEFYEETKKCFEAAGKKHGISVNELQKYLSPCSLPFENRNINDIRRIFLRLCFHSQNATRIKNVIKYDANCSSIRAITFDYDCDKVLKKYNSYLDIELALLSHGISAKGKKSISNYAKSIYSSAKFVSGYKDYNEFKNEMIKDGLNAPYTVANKVYGIGYTLGCDFLKELDTSFDICKPDKHVGECIKYFISNFEAKIDQLQNEFLKITKSINKAIPNLNISNYSLDKMIYLICSENFYLHDNKKNNTDKHRLDYINHLKAIGCIRIDMKIKYFYNKDKNCYSIANVESFDKTIIIPSEHEGKPVTSIDDWAFQDCISLEEVCLPHTIRYIGRNAFNSCNHLITTFTYGHIFNLDDLMVNRGNANMLMSSITHFGDEEMVNEILEKWFKTKTTLSLKTSDIFKFESIHYIRVALMKWADEKSLKGHWIYCDELDINETFNAPNDCDFIVLDSVDCDSDDKYIEYIHNIINKSLSLKIPVIGLMRKPKETDERITSFFANCECVSDERLEILKNNLELKKAISILSNSNYRGKKMKNIIFTIQNTSWGRNEKRRYEFDLESKTLNSFESDSGEFNRTLANDEIKRIEHFFNVYLVEYARNGDYGFDAPIFTLEIDGKVVSKGIADINNAQYCRLEEFVDSFLIEVLI